jgi:hypothetical protein
MKCLKLRGYAIRCHYDFVVDASNTSWDHYGMVEVV